MNVRFNHFLPRLRRVAAVDKTFQQARNEFLRKGIHFLIALTPAMAALSKPWTTVFLTAGVLVYIYLESLRLAGHNIPFFSSITRAASRPRDKERFVMGPVTLGSGALLALLLYPSMAAAIAIYALAFGDGFAALVGRLFGRIKPRFLFGKSVEGSLACFFAVLIAAWHVSHNVTISLVAAFSATIVEALPLEDYDNLAIPLAAGFAVKLCTEMIRSS